MRVFTELIFPASQRIAETFSRRDPFFPVGQSRNKIHLKEANFAASTTLASQDFSCRLPEISKQQLSCTFFLKKSKQMSVSHTHKINNDFFLQRKRTMGFCSTMGVPTSAQIQRGVWSSLYVVGKSLQKCTNPYPPALTTLGKCAAVTQPAAGEV